MPRTRAALALTLARFAFQDKSLVLLTQGLGPQPFHGKIVILVNEWTNSAAEMVASFAADHRLATIVGNKTPPEGLENHLAACRRAIFLAV